MTSSGSSSFNPAIGEFVLYCYGLCGIRRAAIAQEHLVDARMAMNLMLAEWNNDTPNLWKVDLVEVPLVQGQAVYPVDPSTIMVLDIYWRVNDGNGNPIDTIIWPLSRTEYASMPNKDMQGRVTSFWFDRLLSPSITLWQVPDGNGPYLLRYYRVTQIFDANLQGGETLDLPNRWFGAFAWGLASRLAHSYAPEQVMRLEAKAQQALQNAQEEDTEDVPLFLSPSINSYYSR
ncbi:phage adaptor protein [Rhizobium lusitanum]|uniref:Uncharacterized protein n=1 Tax=Rhizobium lusitanum TaxID=293958 RepID=A0A1C3VR64_9HYPH|nr:hypothetical protein [Rhizobium lusitanum]SCB30290.1 hypothetical protein GA0061101_10687 [Rhizobium lusitanum]